MRDLYREGEQLKDYIKTKYYNDEMAKYIFERLNKLLRCYKVKDKYVYYYFKKEAVEEIKKLEKILDN